MKCLLDDMKKHFQQIKMYINVIRNVHSTNLCNYFVFIEYYKISNYIKYKLIVIKGKFHVFLW